MTDYGRTFWLTKKHTKIIQGSAQDTDFKWNGWEIHPTPKQNSEVSGEMMEK